MDTSSVDTLQRNIHDPSLFAGTVFKEMLVSKGLNIKKIIKGSVPKNAMKIIEHKSKPIVHSLNGLMKRSENIENIMIIN